LDWWTIIASGWIGGFSFVIRDRVASDPYRRLAVAMCCFATGRMCEADWIIGVAMRSKKAKPQFGERLRTVISQLPGAAGISRLADDIADLGANLPRAGRSVLHGDRCVCSSLGVWRMSSRCSTSLGHPLQDAPVYINDKSA